MAEPMQVEVVSADRVVWSGKSSNIIAKTVEGEIGILPGHEPMLGVLVPSAVVIFCEDNPTREIIAVVPDRRKAAAVHACLEGTISPAAPASILRTHARATIYLDRESASRLAPETRGEIFENGAS